MGASGSTARSLAALWASTALWVGVPGALYEAWRLHRSWKLAAIAPAPDWLVALELLLVVLGGAASSLARWRRSGFVVPISSSVYALTILIAGAGMVVAVRAAVPASLTRVLVVGTAAALGGLCAAVACTAQGVQSESAEASPDELPDLKSAILMGFAAAVASHLSQLTYLVVFSYSMMPFLGALTGGFYVFFPLLLLAPLALVFVVPAVLFARLSGWVAPALAVLVVKGLRPDTRRCSVLLLVATVVTARAVLWAFLAFAPALLLSPVEHPPVHGQPSPPPPPREAPDPTRLIWAGVLMEGIAACLATRWSAGWPRRGGEASRGALGRVDDDGQRRARLGEWRRP